MNRSKHAEWMHAGSTAWLLGMEASMVVALRLTKFAAGADPKGTEARLMVDEKLRALREMQAGVLTGRFGPTAPGVENALKLYGRKVSANRRRLSR